MICNSNTQSADCSTINNNKHSNQNKKSKYSLIFKLVSFSAMGMLFTVLVCLYCHYTRPDKRKFRFPPDIRPKSACSYSIYENPNNTDIDEFSENNPNVIMLRELKDEVERTKNFRKKNYGIESKDNDIEESLTSDNDEVTVSFQSFPTPLTKSPHSTPPRAPSPIHSTPIPTPFPTI